MTALADKLAALLSSAALKIVRLRVSVWYLGVVVWRLKQAHPDLLPELPACAFFDPAYQQACKANLAMAFRRGMRCNLSTNTLELSGIEGRKILEGLREEGCASSIRIIGPLVAAFAAMIDSEPA